jgi:hypothetical protein
VFVFVALVGRWPGLLPLGVFTVGAAYAAALAFRSGGVDSHAPLVAAGLFVATECAYISVGRSASRPTPELIARRVVFTLVTGVGAALVGALVLVAANTSARGLGFEILGAVAALLILFFIAAVSFRTNT